LLIYNQGRQMRTNVFVAVVGLIIGGLIVLLYNMFVALPARPLSPCGGSPHCLDVSVISVGGQPQIVPIADEPVHDQGVMIFWKIATPGYSFPINGIAFNKPAFPTPSGELTCAPVNSTTFRCKDSYHTMGKFGYIVTLEGSPAAPPLDPFIINN
jgi:hypothetical protein